VRIDVRNVPDQVVRELDVRAKKKGKSREAYIRDQLILLAQYPAISNTDIKYRSVQEATLVALDENTKVLKRIDKMLRRYELLTGKEENTDENEKNVQY
jgi:plasmid stability protein